MLLVGLLGHERHRALLHVIEPLVKGGIGVGEACSLLVQSVFQQPTDPFADERGGHKALFDQSEGGLHEEMEAGSWTSARGGPGKNALVVRW